MVCPGKCGPQPFTFGEVCWADQAEIREDISPGMKHETDERNRPFVTRSWIRKMGSLFFSASICLGSVLVYSWIFW
jgi:hypothetical protein